MKLLFENWRKYIIEVDTDNDGIDNEPEEEEEGDEEKIFNAFLDNGAHGLYLAEMVLGDNYFHDELKDIVKLVRHYISVIEDPEANAPWDSGPHFKTRMTGRRADVLGEILYDYVKFAGSKVYAVAETLNWGDERRLLVITDEFEEMMAEAGDYVWWHGKYANKSPTYNIASKERSTALLSDLKEWAGV